MSSADGSEHVLGLPFMEACFVTRAKSENAFSGILNIFNICFVKYAIPEVREASRNLPGARGFAVIEYGPRILILDPIHLIFCQLSST